MIEAQRLLEQDMLGRVGQMLLATDDVRDLHERVIDDDCEMVGREAVGLSNDEILQLTGSETDFPEHDILHHDLPIRNLETKDMRATLIEILLDRLGGQVQRRPVVAIGLLVGTCDLAGLVQLLRRLERAVGGTRLDQAIEVLVVDVESLRLEVRPGITATARIVLGTFVPVDSQPGQILEKGKAGRIARSLLVGVLDAKQEAAAMTPGVGPAEQCGSSTTDMEMPGGTWCEPCSND